MGYIKIDEMAMTRLDINQKELIIYNYKKQIQNKFPNLLLFELEMILNNSINLIKY